MTFKKTKNNKKQGKQKKFPFFFFQITVFSLLLTLITFVFINQKKDQESFQKKEPKQSQALTEKLIHQDGKYELTPTHQPVSLVKTSGKISNGDLEIGLEEERIVLRKNERIFYETDQEWKVTNFIFCDLNHDGEKELTFSLWKDHDLTRWHFKKTEITGWHGFLYLSNLSQNPPKKIWQSSALKKPLISIQCADLDDDGLEELITLEGKYQNNRFDALKTGSVNVLKWNGFGFTKEFESLKTNFQTIEKKGEEILLN